MKRTITVVFTALLVSASVAIAQDRERPDRDASSERRGGGRNVEGGLEALGRAKGAGEDRLLAMIIRSPEMAEQLGIDKEQLESLRNEYYTYKEVMVDLQAVSKKLELAQSREWLKDEPDQEVIMEHIQKAGEFRTKMAQLKAKHALILNKAFTKDQKKQIQDMVRKRMQQRTQKQRGDAEGGEVKRGRGDPDAEGGDFKKRGKVRDWVGPEEE